MSIFFPDYLTPKAICLSPPQLKALGIEGILLDVDNTLTTHNNPDPYPGVEQWLAQLAQAGIGAVIVSNNRPERVEPFARRLGLPYVAKGAKPLAKGYRQGAELLLGKDNRDYRRLAAVGDQLFTDIAGGNLLGATTILVTQITPEEGWFFRVKRWLERKIFPPRRWNGISWIGQDCPPGQ